MTLPIGSEDKYHPHPLGNYALCGLNMLGTHSIILWENNIYTFKHFGNNRSPKEHLAYYQGENCEDKWFTYDRVRASIRLEKKN